ncbi:MAG TPA: ABC transporter permease [Acidimicrobiia bacterium]|nr:ABC transporter permease [Acidimicrobiia bacterium]
MTLLTVAVAASIAGSAAAVNLVAATGNAEIGTASHALVFEQPDLRHFELDTAAAERAFETVARVGHSGATIAGVFDEVDLRWIDGETALTAPMLDLVAGRYPAAADEIALTDGVARILQAGMGDSVDLGGISRTVVGVVENPSNLSDEFALVDPSSTAELSSASVLVEATDDAVQGFAAPSGAPFTTRGRDPGEAIAAGIGVLAAGTLLLILVSLVATGGFVVLAQRRLRQIGLMAAAGATSRHLHLAMVANGTIVGVTAASIGAGVGLAAWFALGPGLETSVGHRIVASNVPWPLVAASVILAIAAGTMAAWWPARRVSRMPVVAALSGRPPPTSPAGRSGRWGPLLVGVGMLGLYLSGRNLTNWLVLGLLAASICAVVAGIVLLIPRVLAVVGRVGRRASVGVRLAIRDLSRYRSRTAAGLAAISLALGIAVTVVLVTSAALYASAAEGNLADNQLMVRIGEIPSSGDIAPIPERTAGEVDRLEEVVNEITRVIGGGDVTPVEVVVAPEIEGFEGLPAVVLGEQVQPGLFRIVTQLYAVSPELLARYGLEPADVGAGTEVLTAEAGELWYQPVEDELVQHRQILPPGYSSLPGAMMTRAAITARGWDTAPAAWLIDAEGPVSDEHLTEVAALASDAGVTVEARHDQANLVALRNGATAVGFAVALGILAMTVGLIRSEGAGDLRVLTATGAARRIRRSLAAATAGGLAGLGVAVGTLAALLGVAAFQADAGLLSLSPALHLLVVCVGVPLVAVVAAWLMSGGEPGDLGRRPGV